MIFLVSDYSTVKNDITLHFGFALFNKRTILFSFAYVLENASESAAHVVGFSLDYIDQMGTEK